MKSGLPWPLLRAVELLFCSVLLPAARAEDCPQWGQQFTRNMVSPETGLPDRFDPATGKNVKWSASLGTESYSSPVIAGGKVFVGANNGRPRDPRHQGNRGVTSDGRPLGACDLYPGFAVPGVPGDNVAF